MRDQPRRSWRTEIVLVAAFAIGLGLTLWRHEPWRDELQAWMLVRAADGLGDLPGVLRYEGHPWLWHLVLWPVARSIDGPVGMQAVAWLVGVASAAVVVRWSPFTTAQKALLLGSSMVLFEYATIARAYGVAALLTFAACAAASRRPRRWLATGTLLGLLALTSAFGVVLALAVLAGLLVDELRSRRNEPPLAAARPGPVAAIALTAAGTATAALMARVPGDARYAGWHTSWDAGLARSTLAAPFRAFAPFPDTVPAFAGSHLLDGATAIAALLGAMVLAVTVIALRDRPAALVVFAVGTVGTLALLYAKLAYAGAPRHYGHVFLALVAALWLAPAFRSGARVIPRAGTVRGALLTGVLVAQVAAAAWIVGHDAVRPWSGAKAAAEAIEDAGLADGTIVAAPGVAASGIAAYLDRPIVHQPPGALRTYVVWDSSVDAPAPKAEDLARDLAGAGGGVLIVPAGTAAPPGTHTVALVDDAIVADDRFRVLLVPAGG